MRLKRYLKNTIRPGLQFSFLFLLIISSSACLLNLEPTYKENDIPRIITQICKDEYNIDVVTRRTATTLWVYAPFSKLLHKEYGSKEGKIFDEEIMEKLRNISNTIGRVLVNSDKTPEFFVLLASDINIGIDYMVVANVLDIKKSYADFLPWTELNRRYVFKFGMVPQAVGDDSGEHFQPYDIKLPFFLAEQISQRIANRFQEEDLRKYFEIQKSTGVFDNNTFVFEYLIKKVSEPKEKIKPIKEILNIITYCIKTYEFKDFSGVQITDLITGDKLLLSNKEIWTGTIW